MQISFPMYSGLAISINTSCTLFLERLKHKDLEHFEFREQHWTRGQEACALGLAFRLTDLQLVT